MRGVPVYVGPSWIAIGVILTYAYTPVIRDAAPSTARSTAILAAAAFSVVFAGCILAHECGHTVVSLALGHPVRRILLFALGGVSEMDTEPERPRDELLIAGAGPIVSLLISLVAWAAGSAVDTHSVLGALLFLLLWSNLLIAAFNLLPGLPLDGGRLVRAALCGFGMSGPTATVAAAWTGRVVAVLVALSGLFAERTTLGFASGVISVGLAAYLWFGAGLSIRAARLRARLPEIDVEELLRPGLYVPTDISVAEALRRAWERDVRGIVVVDADDTPTAIVDEKRITTTPAEQRAWLPVTSVARPIESGLLLPRGLDASTLLARMRAFPASEYLVVGVDGAPAGIIATRDFALRLNGGVA